MDLMTLRGQNAGMGHSPEPTRPPYPLGDALRYLRTRRQWSQRDLADQAGIGYRTVIRIESGKPKGNTYKVVSALARAFGLHDMDLAIFQSPTPPPPIRRGTTEQRALRHLWVMSFKRTTPEVSDAMGSMQSALATALATPPVGMEDLQLTTNPRLEPLRPILRALRVNPDGMLLVCCPRARELTNEVRDSDRVVVWADPEVNTAHQRMPPSIVAVVFVTFPGHRGTGHIQREARRIGAQIHHATISPRTVHDLCDEAGLLTMHKDHHAATTTTPTAPPEYRAPSGKARMGVVVNFLDKHADWNATVATKEIDRLFALAQTEGLPSTKGSIAQAFYFQKRRRQRALPAATAEPAEPPPVILDTGAMITATTVQPAPVIDVVAPVDPAVSDALTRDFDALLALVDDSLLAQQLVKDSLIALRPIIIDANRAQLETVNLKAKLDRVRSLFTEGETL